MVKTDIDLSSLRPAAIPARYVELEALGSGGMGEVWKARDRFLDRMVAVKVLHACGSDVASMVARFRREAAVLARLTHPAVVTIYDLHEGPAGVCYAMELVVGRSLADAFDAGDLPPADLVRVMADVSEAVAEAHGLGVVHRDLTPGNVLVDRDGRGRILDFGVARILGDEEPAPLTRTGFVVGTLSRLPPEAFAGTKVGPPGDVYQMGLLLWEGLVGERPFRGSAEVARDVLADGGGLPRLRSRLPAVSPLLDALVASALSSNPDERPDAATFHERLASSIPEGSGERIAPGPATGESPSPSPKRSSSPRSLAAALLLGLLVCGALVTAFRSFLSGGGKAVGVSMRAVVPRRWTWELETPRGGCLVVDWPSACRVTALRDSRTGRLLSVEIADPDGIMRTRHRLRIPVEGEGLVRPVVEGELAEGRGFRAVIDGELPGCRGILRRFRSAMDAFLHRDGGARSTFEEVLGELRRAFRGRLKARGISIADEEAVGEAMADLRISTRRRIRSLPVHRTFSRLSAWLPLCFEDGAAPGEAVLEAWRDLLVLARCDQTTLALLGEAFFEVDGVLEAVAPEWRVAHGELPRVEARLRAERDRTVLPLSRSVLERSDAASALAATGREWKNAMDGLAFIKEAAPELDGAFSFDPKATPDHLEAVVDGVPPGARRLEVGGVVFNLTPFLVLRLQLVGVRTGRRVELLLRNSPAAYLGYQGGARRLGARRQLVGRSLPATWFEDEPLRVLLELESVDPPARSLVNVTRVWMRWSP